MIDSQSRIILIMLIYALVIVGCTADTDRTAQTKAETAEVSDQPHDSLVIELTGVDSMSVLDLLEAGYPIEKVESVAGTFVKAINSVENNSSFFWLYSVNDSMGQVASDKYITHDSDRVKWHYRQYD